MVYKNRKNASLKWILGLIVFVLAMTITFSDVSGFSFPTGRGNSGYTGGNGSNGGGDATPSYLGNQREFDSPDRSPEKTTPPPPQVPEPGTIILLGSGLVGLWAARRRRTN